MIIAGASAYSRDWDYKRMRKLADEIGAILMADISHPSGLIATGLLNNPVNHCHILTTTTHKTLRGPRGGIIMMGKDFENPFGITTKKGTTRKMSSLLDSAVFPGTQGGPLMNQIAGKTQSYYEASKTDFKQYGQDVLDMARHMCEVLKSNGIKITTDGTDSHIILIHTGDKSGAEVADKLEDIYNIVVNKNPEEILESILSFPMLDMITFTGGVSVGLLIQQKMMDHGHGLKRFVPELGGCSS